MEESDATPSSHTSRNTKEPLSSVPGCKDGGELPEVEDEGVNTGCGWFRFRPKILAPFAHVWTFIVLYIVFSFTHAVQGSYPIAVLTTLERRFNIPSYLAGFIVHTSLVGNLISIAIVSFFFAKTNKPRLFASCMLLTSIAAFLYFLPHIVSGNDVIDVGLDPTLNSTALPRTGSEMVQLCGTDSGSGGSSSEKKQSRMCGVDERETAADDEGVSYVMSAVVIIAIADLVHGIAGAPAWTVGLAYMDDHTEPELSAKLIGLMYTVRMTSPIVSFAMGGYLLSIHTTLKETDLTPKHPQWIGAWWMGFLINAIINFIIFIPMSMLPRNLRPIKKSSSSNAISPENGKAIAEEEVEQDESGKEAENRKAVGEEQITKKKENEDDVEKEEKHETEEDEEAKVEEEKKNDDGEEKKEDRKAEKNVEEMVTSVVPVQPASGPMKCVKAKGASSLIDRKEFRRVMVRLITNPIYVLTVIAICSDWSALGFMLFIPKYFEAHFQKTASVASLLGGMIPATFAAAASYVGGVVTGKIKGKDGGVAGLCRMNFYLTLISVLLFVPASLLSCPQIRYSGHQLKDGLNVTTDCNVNCGCSSDVFDPVCSSDDGLLYFSPCHAGCTHLVNLSTALHRNDRQGRLVRSEECRCVAEAEGKDEDGGEGGETKGGGGGSIVFAGFCDESCASLIPYVVILVAIVVVSNLYNSSCTTILLRCIKEEDKSFALGLVTLCISLTLLPIPLLYGTIFDSSCILKSTTTPCTTSKGSCQLYDRHALRLRFHGLAMGLKSIATILYCFAYLLARRKLSLLTVTVPQKMVELIAMETKNETTM